MKVCVIGGAGYIGSHAVYELIRAHHQVVVIDNLSTGSKASVHPKATFIWGDITDYDQFKKVFSEENQRERFDAVMHFAAKIIVSQSVSNPLDYYFNNVEGVRIMLKVMVEEGVQNIVFSSTAAVYGEPTKPICVESDPCKPINPYGETKLSAEKLIQWVCNAHQMNYCIFRYFNVAGADESLEIGLLNDVLTHIIPLTVQTALKIRDELTIFGDDYPTEDGSCVRDYIHVSDLAYAHILGMEYIQKNQQSLILNLGSGQGYSVKEVVEQVSRHYAVNTKIGPRRPGDPAVLIASNQLAKQLLGWQPSKTLADIIQSDLDFRIKQQKTSD